MLKVLDHLEEWLISFLMGAATLIIFVAVVHRYASGLPIPGVQDWLLGLNFGWAQELCIIMFVWMAKFGAAYGVRTGIHVGVDVLINRLSERHRAKFIVFGLLAGAIVHRHRRHARRDLRLGERRAPGDLQAARSRHRRPSRRADDARPRGADLDRLFGGSARLVPDVLPLPAGDVGLPAHRRAAAPRPEQGRGHRGAGLTCRRARKTRSTAWKTTSTRATSPTHEGRAAMNTVLIFALLVLLMLTGMPISISLGLTVLSFLFFMTQVPIESVALKLFTGIEKFEIMAIPFFILAGNFLTHGGVAKRMIRFATSMVGHFHGGLGLAGVLACALFAAVSGSSPATVVAIGSILLPAMVRAGLPQALRRRRHHDLGRARHPDPAVDRDGDVLGVDQHLGRRALHGRRHSRHRPGDDARPHDLVPGAQQQLSAPAEGELGGQAEGVPRLVLGPGADRHRDGRHLHRPLHADRGGGDERGVGLHRRGLHLQGPAA